MKTAIAIISCALSTLGSLSCSGATSALAQSKTLTAEELANICDDAAEGRPHPDFLVPSGKIEINAKYKIDLFKSNSADQVNTITAILQKGTQNHQVETPRFAAICFGKQLQAPDPKNKGNIQWPLDVGKKVTMVIRLGNFQYTHWKPKAGDSVWMTAYIQGHTPIPPKPGEWVDACFTKAVSPLSNRDISFPLNMCPDNENGDRYNLEYAVHMDQTDDGSTVDIGIDPFIFNRP
jgi:hypothetical protein